MARKRKRTKSSKRRRETRPRGSDARVFEAGLRASFLLTESNLFQAILKIMRDHAELELRRRYVEVVVQEAEKASMEDPSDG